MLVAFALVFYRQLAFGGRVLVTFDSLAYFYPNLAFLGESLRAGRIPLWNPLLFAGAPFLANPQTGVFYPPNWLAAVAPAATAYSWSVVLHGLIGAVGAYAFGRRALRIGPTGALATALVFAFGGFFSAQAVHLNQMAAAAWLPWLLLVVEALLRRPTVPFALLGSAILALQMLAGHSQVVFLSACALGVYGLSVGVADLRDELRRGIRGQSLARWAAPRVAALALFGGVGVGLAATQLLPTLELSREGIRSGGLDFAEAASFSLPPWKLLVALLPTFGRVGVFSEWVSYVGVVALVLAGVALVGWSDRRVVALGALVACGFLLSLGKFTPVYQLLVEHAPGFDLFRVPARWLLLYNVGLAGLAGYGLDRLTSLPRTAVESDWRRLALRLLALGGAVVVALGAYQSLQRGFPLEHAAGRVAAAWALTAAVAAGIFLLALARPRLGRLASASLVGLLGAELLVASLGLDLNRVNVLEAAAAPTAEISYLRSQDGLFRTLGLSETAYEVGDVNAIRAQLAAALTPDEVYDYLVALKHKETLTPNLPLAFGVPSLDGYDGGVLPLKQFLDLKTLFPVEGNVVVDGRLRLQVRSVPDPRLLGWLNVRYVVADRAGDLWQDGRYYDLGFAREVVANRPLTIESPAGGAFEGVGLVATADSGGAPTGAIVGTLTLTDRAGSRRAFPLRMGTEVAPGGAEKPKAARIDLGGPFEVARVEVSAAPATSRLVVRAVILLGVSPANDRVLDLSTDFRTVYLGDTKIYENLAVKPRAYFSPTVRIAADDAAARAMLSPNAASADEPAVLVRRDLPIGSTIEDSSARSALAGDGANRGAVRIDGYAPERVTLSVDAAEAGLLVLTDADYPGWVARVDGVEVPIVRTNLLFRGVPVGAGAHRVEFAYEPRSLLLGVLISGMAFAAGLIALATSQVRRRRRSLAYPARV